MSLPELVTTKQLAGLIGISDRRIRQLGAEGSMPKAETGKYRLAEAVQAYCASLREVAAGRGGADLQLDLTKEKARHAKEQADNLSIKNALLRGELLDAKAVEREWANVLSFVRSRMLAVPTDLTQDLPHLSKHDIDVIDRGVRRALEDASRDSGTTEPSEGEGASSSPSSAEDSAI